MASKSEHGNAVNIASLGTFISYVPTIGLPYNPANVHLGPPALTTLFTTATAAQTDANTTLAPYTLAQNAREAIYAPVPKQITQLRKALKATDGITPQLLEDFDTLARKYKGERKTAIDPADPDKTTSSVAKLSYDQRANTLGEIIALLQSIPGFDPNETQYKVAYYIALKADMLNSTKQVKLAEAPYTMAISKRDTILYKQPNNLVEIGNKAKAYCSTILPANDPVLKAIKKLKFKTPSYIKT